MKIPLLSFLLIIFAISSFSVEISVAQEAEKNRLELQYIFEHIEPDSVYHPWHSFYINYFRMQSPTFSYFVNFGSIYREDDTDFIGIVGVVKDWSSRFYTYTAFAMGTKSSYLPKYRIDNEINIKLGMERNIVWTIGGAYMEYHTETEDLILFTGLSVEHNKWNLLYRIFRNQSIPGDALSYTHLGSIGYGMEKKYFTFLGYSRGSQAYLALQVTQPEEIRRKVFRIYLNHRHWIKRNTGIFIDLSFLELKNEYDIYGVSVGLFREF
ncbi:MAG: YaiO family outer membrane beta-barrel protein [candidate division Zixibacteria bacterium]|nr:YaiO family outer membrane beta-barrel protein [candidate division Zixibacteria bacterium]